MLSFDDFCEFVAGILGEHPDVASLMVINGSAYLTLKNDSQCALDLREPHAKMLQGTEPKDIFDMLARQIQRVFQDAMAKLPPEERIVPVLRAPRQPHVGGNDLDGVSSSWHGLRVDYAIWSPPDRFEPLTWGQAEQLAEVWTVEDLHTAALINLAGITGTVITSLQNDVIRIQGDDRLCASRVLLPGFIHQIAALDQSVPETCWGHVGLCLPDDNLIVAVPGHDPDMVAQLAQDVRMVWGQPVAEGLAPRPLSRRVMVIDAHTDERIV